MATVQDSGFLARTVNENEVIEARRTNLIYISLEDTTSINITRENVPAVTCLKLRFLIATCI